MTQQELLYAYYPGAVEAANGSGIFPQTLISQLILESGYNLSKLATKYFNFFGIKATPTWGGKVVSLNTYEYNQNGGKYLVYGTNTLYVSYSAAIQAGANKMSLFRVYNNTKQGFADYINFLKSNSRYKNVFKATTPQQQFTALQNAGYATSLTYASDLTNIYNSIKNNLPAIAATGGGLLILATIAYFVFKK